MADGSKYYLRSGAGRVGAERVGGEPRREGEFEGGHIAQEERGGEVNVSVGAGREVGSLAASAPASAPAHASAAYASEPAVHATATDLSSNSGGGASNSTQGEAGVVTGGAVSAMGASRTMDSYQVGSEVPQHVARVHRVDSPALKKTSSGGESREGGVSIPRSAIRVNSVFRTNYRLPDIRKGALIRGVAQLIRRQNPPAPMRVEEEQDPSQKSPPQEKPPSRQPTPEQTFYGTPESYPQTGYFRAEAAPAPDAGAFVNTLKHMTPEELMYMEEAIAQARWEAQFGKGEEERREVVPEVQHQPAVEAPPPVTVAANPREGEPGRGRRGLPMYYTEDDDLQSVVYEVGHQFAFSPLVEPYNMHYATADDANYKGNPSARKWPEEWTGERAFKGTGAQEVSELMDSFVHHLGTFAEPKRMPTVVDACTSFVRACSRPSRALDEMGAHTQAALQVVQKCMWQDTIQGQPVLRTLRRKEQLYKFASELRKLLKNSFRPTGGEDMQAYRTFSARDASGKLRFTDPIGLVSAYQRVYQELEGEKPSQLAAILRLFQLLNELQGEVTWPSGAREDPLGMRVQLHYTKNRLDPTFEGVRELANECFMYARKQCIENGAVIQGSAVTSASIKAAPHTRQGNVHAVVAGGASRGTYPPCSACGYTTHTIDACWHANPALAPATFQPKNAKGWEVWRKSVLALGRPDPGVFPGQGGGRNASGASYPRAPGPSFLTTPTPAGGRGFGRGFGRGPPGAHTMKHQNMQAALGAQAKQFNVAPVSQCAGSEVSYPDDSVSQIKVDSSVLQFFEQYMREKKYGAKGSEISSVPIVRPSTIEWRENQQRLHQIAATEQEQARQAHAAQNAGPGAGGGATWVGTRRFFRAGVSSSSPLRTGMPHLTRQGLAST